MNHIYRIVFNHALGLFQAVSEVAKGRSSGGTSRTRRRASLRRLAASGICAVGLLNVSGLALADGGKGGDAGGTPGGAGGTGTSPNGSTAISGGGGGASYSTGVGGTGGNAQGGAGGNIGQMIITNTSLLVPVAGANGVAGGTFSGGGAGGAGVVVLNSTPGSTTTTSSNSSIAGGNGGTGGSGGVAGGGGAGGDGFLGLSLSSLVSHLSIVGGRGGDGGDGANTGGGGDGGIGINLRQGGIINQDSGSVVSGGDGGAGVAGAGLVFSAYGKGGAGIVSVGPLTINTAGSISGGVGLGGRANAITFLASHNTLELLSGSIIIGNVDATAGTGDTFRLSGNTAGSIDISQIKGFEVFEKSGNGTWSLTGTASTAMPWLVSAGTLQGNTASLLGDITNNATVNFDQSSNGTYADNMSGSGALVKTGTGTVTLTGINSYSGGTTVSAGTLEGNADSLQGDITNNAALVFDQATLGLYNGVISGTGSLTKTGVGTLTLLGANNYSGDTTISGGSLRTGAANVLSANSALILDANTALVTNNFNQTIGGLAGSGAINLGSARLTTGSSVDTIFGGVITGTGGLTKIGAGALNLTAINTYSGATNVNAGTLSVNGSITGSTITINNGGTLGGSGGVGNVSVMSGGVLAPGNSIGTLTVNGDLTFNSGGIYRVEVDALGNTDRTVVNGNLALNGNVDVQASAGTYAANTAYTILTNTGTQTGTFAGVTSNLAFLTPTLSYGANNVVLNLARNNINFSNVAATSNQRASSTALEKAAAGASGDMSTVLTAVTGLSADDARAAYDAIGGAGLNALRRAAPAFANNFGNQLRARLNAVGASASTSANSLNGIQLAANDHINDLMPMLAQAPQQKFTLAGGIPQTPTDTRGFWLRAYGSDQDTDGDGNAAGNRIKDTGISVGFDTKINHDLVIGAALTHGSADINTDNNENGRSRGNAVALYVSYASGAWNFNGSATLARNDNSMQRRIAFGGIDRIAQSDFDSDTAALYGDITYDVAMNGWTLQPLMGLSLSRNKSDAFTETGAGALNLQVAGQTTNSAKTLFGAKAIFDFNKVQLQPRAIWSHEFGDANSAMTSQLQGAPTPFAISGVDLPRDTLIAGLTIVGSTSKRLSLFADVQGEFNSQQTNLGLLVGLRASW